MTRVVETRTTDRAPEEVFAYLADFSNTAEWDPGVASAERLDAGPLGAGSRFAVTAVFLGRPLPMTYTLLEHEPPRRLVLEGFAATSRARDEIVVEAAGEGSRITWTLDLELLGLSRIFERPMRPFLRRLGHAALEGLAARLADPAPLVSGGVAAGDATE